MTDNKEISTVKSQVTKATAAVDDLIIVGGPGLVTATELLAKIKTVGRMVKTEKDKVLAPLLEATKAERARWAPIEDDLENAEGNLKQKMIVFQNMEQKKARDEEARIQLQLETGRIKESTAIKKMEQVEAPVTSVQAKTGGAQFRTVTKVRVIDESLIPREFLVVDEVKLRKAVLEGQLVPGAESYQETEVAGTRS